MSTEQFRAPDRDRRRLLPPAAAPPTLPAPRSTLFSASQPLVSLPPELLQATGAPPEASAVLLSAIRDEQKHSPRLAVARARVRQFRQILQEQGFGAFPPVILAGPRPDGTYAPADGRHRIAAAREAGIAAVPAVVVPWTNEREFFALSLALSARNGLPLTQREKRLAVIRLLREYPDGSVREIAEMAGTSHHLVFVCRKKLQQGLAAERKPYRRKTAADHAEALLTAFDALGDGMQSPEEAQQRPAVLAGVARRRYAAEDPRRELEVLAEWIAAARELLRTKPG